MSDRSDFARQMHSRALSINANIERKSESALEALVSLDTELRQFFDSLSAQDPVTPAELTILEDVGALLNRAKTLAATQRLHVLSELKGLSTSRSGIKAYQSADATH